MTEYLCLTLLANADEPAPAFKSRLTAFWSHLLRTQPDTYEALYAEAVTFELVGGRVSRQYMVEVAAAEPLADALRAGGVEVAPVDTDDTYTKYEASGSEWFQVEH
ncbi:hypothetical protein GobsT_46510 [Gemmata obscuriglobus]|uniref:Uncharacterized protein n=1 Tax=Gemmata obscuriglobus TaxID=114 RepID=A0A2Z3GVP7_9BACT|nr:hypothetical protein [Gemmata obscuriglobus]AWM37388.1 hypothetical protein C1280_10445 [Gemmata obscuriglobus]QEG29853.1 hypothetical protein GobsT_46510 [Gemmata obscuriglobus]VTS09170.1 unnamed protein product [Gemmata obscuriglobus UQM 2246]